MKIESILTRLFGEPEQINGANRCPTYLYRWTVCKLPGKRGIYIHHFVGDDWSRDLHDHPKRFISIGLKGCYVEETLKALTLYRAPWIRSFPATHIHRISVPYKNCWTLVVVLKATRDWGFWHMSRFIPWRRYIDNEGGLADKMKACD
jgi:hypothetical protein